MVKMTNSIIKNCFTLLRLLHENELMQCAELSYKLKVSDKQIRRYVYSLRAAGVDIKSKAGKTGGYYIENNECPLCHNIKQID